MKKLLSIVSCLIFLAGCGQESRKAASIPSQLRWEEKTQSDTFPEFLVGVWKADEFSWAFKFEADGTIPRLEHVFAGKMDVEDEGIYMEGPDEGTFAVFVIGPCEAKYDPNSRQLSVKIVLDRFHMRLPGGDLEGWEEDYFEGPVSEDGKTWTVDWRSYSWLEDASPPDPDLIEANPEKLVFTKLDLAQLQEEGETE
jgi:hypothetical protein